MIGNGRGSINTKIKRYHEAGEHEAKAKMLLDSSIHDVEKAARRTPLTTVKNQLNKVAATQRLVSKTLSVTGKTWQKTARCDSPTPSLSPRGLFNKTHLLSAMLPCKVACRHN